MMDTVMVMDIVAVIMEENSSLRAENKLKEDENNYIYNDMI